jgi:CDGSH-type Zn-finger protein
MGQVTIQPLDNGPFAVKGEVDLLDGEGKTIKVANELHLCRCGLTKNAPYCDGSHVDKFKSEVRTD